MKCIKTYQNCKTRWVVEETKETKQRHEKKSIKNELPDLKIKKM